jgi:hypothetical protein
MNASQEEMKAKLSSNEAEMKTNQEMPARLETKTDVNLKEMKEAIRSNQEKIKEDIRTNSAKADTTLKEMKEELKVGLEAKIQAEIKANNEKFEVIQSPLVSRMDIDQPRSLTTQAGMKPRHTSREVGGRSTLHPVRIREDHQTSGGRHTVMCATNNAGSDETQVHLQAVKTSIDTWTGSPKRDIMDAKKGFHKAIVNTRNDLHDELGLMIQGEAQITKTLIDTMRRSHRSSTGVHHGSCSGASSRP